MNELQKREIEIDEIMEREKIGLGGWLVFAQAAMLLIVFVSALGAASQFYHQQLLKSVLYLVSAGVGIAALIVFYFQKLGFRALFTVSGALLILYGFVIVEPTIPVLYYILLTILTTGVALIILMSYFSKRVRNTFSERGRRLEKERKQNLYGITGWLLLFQAQLFLAIGTVLHRLAGTISVLNREGGAGLSVHGPKVLVVFLLIFAVTACAVICLVLFYKRKAAFRYVYIAFVVVEAVIVVMPNLDRFPTNAAIGGIIVFLPVIIALFRSERVKNTFS